MSDRVFTIRRANIDDLEMIAGLEPLCFSDPWTREMIRDDLEHPLSIYLLGEAEGEVLGYVGFWNVAGECQINNVAVSPFYRRMGIGTALMKATFAVGKTLGAKKANLEVRESNQEGIGLYESLGFVRDGIRKGYYQDNGENAILMSKDL